MNVMNVEILQARPSKENAVTIFIESNQHFHIYHICHIFTFAFGRNIFPACLICNCKATNNNNFVSLIALSDAKN